MPFSRMQIRNILYNYGEQNMLVTLLALYHVLQMQDPVHFMVYSSVHIWSISDFNMCFCGWQS